MSNSDVAILNRILEYQRKLTISLSELKKSKSDIQQEIIEDSISFAVIQICELYEKLEINVQIQLDFVDKQFFKRVRNRMVHNYGAIDMIFIKAFANKLSSRKAIEKVAEIRADKKQQKKEPELTL